MWQKYEVIGARNRSLPLRPRRRRCGKKPMVWLFRQGVFESEHHSSEWSSRRKGRHSKKRAPAFPPILIQSNFSDFGPKNVKTALCNGRQFLRRVALGRGKPDLRILWETEVKKLSRCWMSFQVLGIWKVLYLSLSTTWSSRYTKTPLENGP